MQETRIPPLGREDSLEEEMATHSGISCWENPMDRGAWWTMVHWVTKSWSTHIQVIVTLGGMCSEFRYVYHLKYDTCMKHQQGSCPITWTNTRQEHPGETPNALRSLALHQMAGVHACFFSPQPEEAKSVVARLQDAPGILPSWS